MHNIRETWVLRRGGVEKKGKEKKYIYITQHIKTKTKTKITQPLQICIGPTIPIG